MSSRVAMLTTLDNPFNPFTDWSNWQRFDEDHGYYTMNYLDRIAVLSPDLSTDDYNEAVEAAINEIVELNLTGNYKKIYEDENLPIPPVKTGVGVA